MTQTRTQQPLAVVSTVTGYRASCLVDREGPAVFIGRRREDGENDLIALIPHEGDNSSAVADANNIVRACNNHDALVEAVTAASHALRSYQYGNTAPALAEEIAGFCDTVLAALSDTTAGEKQ